MANLPLEGQAVGPRPVPKNYKDFEVNRREYRKKVHVMRKHYIAEWNARREREAAALRYCSS